MDASDNAVTLQYRLNGYDAAEEIALSGCSSVLACRLDDLPVGSGGRILEFSILLTDVCPGKRIALGVELSRPGANGPEEPCGLKTFMLPAHNEAGKRDLLIGNIRFVLPEDGESDGEICRYIVRKTAHYVDRNDACPVRRREDTQRQ